MFFHPDSPNLCSFRWSYTNWGQPRQPCWGINTIVRIQLYGEHLPQLLGDPHKDLGTCLLHMWCGLHSSSGILFSWWLSLRELPGVQVSWTPLLIFLWGSYPLQGPQYFPQLFHKNPWPPFSVRVWYFFSICLSQLLDRTSHQSYARLLSTSLTEHH